MLLNMRALTRLLTLAVIASMLTLGVVSASSAATGAGRGGRDTAPHPTSALRGVNAAAAATSVITGLVYNGRGHALDDIQVEAFSAADPGGEPVASDLTYEYGDVGSHGAYQLHVPAGDYLVRFSSPDWVARPLQTTFYGGGAGAPVTVADAATKTLDDVTLFRASGATVDGTVLTPSGDALPNVRVSLIRRYAGGGTSWFGSTYTDESGHYAFTGVAHDRDFTIGVSGLQDYEDSYVGYPDLFLGNAASADDATTFSIPSASSSRTLDPLRMIDGVLVTGHVTGPGGDVPDYTAIGAYLAHSGAAPTYLRSYYTGGGDFAIPLLPGQTYTVSATPEAGWNPDYDELFLGDTTQGESATPFTLGAATTDVGTIDFAHLTTLPRLSVTVLDADGDPVAGNVGVEVLFWKQEGNNPFVLDRSARPQDDGTWSRRVTPGGTYTVQAVDYSQQPAQSVFLGGAATAADALPVTIDGNTSAGTIQLGTTPRKFRGTVVDDADHGIADVPVSLYGWRDRPGARHRFLGQARTTQEGAYRIAIPSWAARRFPHFALSADGSDLGYSTPVAETPTYPLPDLVTDVDPFRLQLDEGVVRGTITGLPTSGGSAYVYLSRWVTNDGESYWERYNHDVWTSSGSYVLRGIEPGTYAAEVDAYDPDTDTWFYGGTGGANLPSGPDAPGAFTVSADANPTIVEPINVVAPNTLTGHVTTEGGGPLPHQAQVHLYRWVSEGGEQQLGEQASTWLQDGRYSFSGLEPGQYAVSVDSYEEESPYRTSWAGGHRPTSPDDSSTITVEAGVTSTVAPDVQLLSRHRVVGTVLDETDSPLTGAQVTLWGRVWWCPCWGAIDSATTDARGGYSFATPGGTNYNLLTVSASDPRFGYAETFVGGGTSVYDAPTYPRDEEADLAVADIALAPDAGTLRGLVDTGDGEALAGQTYLELYQWHDDGDGGGWFQYVNNLWTSSREGHYAFRNLEPGSYAVKAYPSEEEVARYLPTWGDGGSTAPTAPDQPGVIQVVDGTNPTEAGTLSLRRGIGFSGTVTSPDGTPLEGVDVEVYDDTVGRWASSETNSAGHYALRVEPGNPVQVYANRSGFNNWSSDGQVAVGETEDVSYPITLTPQWGDVGAVAGQQDETCLAQTSSDIDFDGLQLNVGPGGRLQQDDTNAYANPFAGNVDPVLAPLYNSEGGWPTWGVSEDGQTLCVQWGGSSNVSRVADRPRQSSFYWGDPTYQVRLTKAAEGGYDVTYNYDAVPSASSSQRAGYTDGLRRHGEPVTFPGYADGGYADGASTALTANSLGSDHPGRYQFHYDGFEDRGAAPELQGGLRILGGHSIGSTLTAVPGQWSVDGVRNDQVDIIFTWFRGGHTLGHGTTYVAQSGDFRRAIRLEAEAWLPHHQVATSTTRTRIWRGSVAATGLAPTLSPSAPSYGDTITADPGGWTPADDLGTGQVTLTYQWFRNGSLVRSATGATYPTTDSDAGKRISVQVSASAPGHGTASATSDQVSVGEMPQLEATTEPALSGPPQVGQPLSVTPGEWSAGQQPMTTTYTWYVDGRERSADEGSDGRSYTPVEADRWSYVSVVVRTHASGFRDGTWSTSVGPVNPADVVVGDLTVHVQDGGDQTAVSGAYVVACDQAWTCLPGGNTDANGDFHASAVSGSTYTVYAYPSDDHRTASTRVTMPASGPETATVRVTRPTPPPANVTIPSSNGSYDGAPMVYWQQDQQFEVTGCPGVTSPSYTVTFSDGTPARSAALTEGATNGGLATYAATIPAFYPSHGDIVISTNIPANCAPGTPPTAINVYIDPSGVVTDQYGRPIDGATVTLSRSANAGGPYAVVPDGSAIMSADNRNNPSTTGPDGFFRWDVTDGWYRVKAAAPGCTTVSTDPMQVPPPKVDLLIALTCTAAAPTATPTITGTPAVGSTLTTGTSIWGDLSDVTIAWLRDGQPIPGASAPTYLVGSADAGHAISVRQTAKRPQYVQDGGRGTPVTFSAAPPATSSTVNVPAVVPPGGGGGGGGGDTSAPTVTGAPALTGSGKVDTALMAPTPAWSLDGVVTTVQWYVEGSPVSGADASTYQVRASDVGKSITAHYRGVKTGRDPGQAVSTAVTGLLGDAAVATKAPTVSGKAAYGHALTASSGSWDQTGLTFHYRWLRDGDEIAGATDATYVPTVDDATAELTVLVSALRTGHADGSATSAPVRVAKLESSTRARLQQKRISVGDVARLTGRVTVEGTPRPTGTVQVLDGGQVFGTYRLRQTTKGVVMANLRHLDAGRHQLRVRYLGGADVARSTSAPVLLVVTGKHQRSHDRVPGSVRAYVG